MPQSLASWGMSNISGNNWRGFSRSLSRSRSLQERWNQVITQMRQNIINTEGVNIEDMCYLSHNPDEGFRLWHLMDSRGGCEGWGGVLGPATSSPAPSVQPDSAYSPVIAYIDSCLLLITLMTFVNILHCQYFISLLYNIVAIMERPNKYQCAFHFSLRFIVYLYVPLPARVFSRESVLGHSLT